MSGRPGDRSIRDFAHMLDTWEKQLSDWEDANPKSTPPWVRNMGSTMRKQIFIMLFHSESMRSDATLEGLRRSQAAYNEAGQVVRSFRS